MKTYRGAPAAARNYVESDRGRADDYYLAEGSGLAQRFSADTAGRVTAEAALSGDAYEAWVAGVDPDTGVPRGRLRHDDKAVRFVEVVVNGPKSWSLAAELHPDIAAAYDAAQDRAAEQIIGWLGRHATTRIGPRGAQVQIPVDRLEAVTVRHYTSRAGDPHRHLHLQVNARVFAAGTWRGLHTVGVRDSLDAINGIGHAAVATDPQFRAALATRGLTLDLETGEVEQLAPFVGAFSARAAQIARNLDDLEADWRAAHPGQTPGPALRRSWDARAWAMGRPDKIHSVPASVLSDRWRQTLHELGYHAPGHRAPPTADTTAPRGHGDGPTHESTGASSGSGARSGWLPIGMLDRDKAVAEVLTRLAARRSGWNAADIRGEVEQLLARRGIVTIPSVRQELAEDLTARTVEACVPLLGRTGVPEHIRALTSQQVLEVEADLVTRLAARGATPAKHVTPATPATGPSPGSASGSGLVADERMLDPTQAAAARLLAGRHQLVLVEGAAGAGKTTTLAAARDLLATRGRRLTVVTPTLRAAQVAEAELGPNPTARSSTSGAGGTSNAHTNTGAQSSADARPRSDARSGTATGPHGRFRARDVWRAAQNVRRSKVLPASAGSAAALVFAHGFRWDEHGAWSRLRPGQADPATGRVYAGPPAGALLRAGDLLVIDEAGMLDQDTARALLTIADEQRVRVALLGDRHQLSAVGRGGVLELAARWADPQAQLTLDGVHRFIRTVATPDGGQIIEPDAEYARISLALRTGELPDQTFQALFERGQIRLHASDTDRVTALADAAAADPSRAADPNRATVIIADTREQVHQLNAAIRDRHVTAGRVDDRHTVATTAGERVGVGDRVVTRRNDPSLQVANRDTWTVAALGPDGALAVLGEHGTRLLPAAYVTAHVELGYACTVHGVQGQTATAAHLALGEHTGAASAYVALTRGREANIAHLVADTVDQAREQWVAAFARARADLGPAHAAHLAETDAANYAFMRPVEEVLVELRTAWAREQHMIEQLDQAQHTADLLRTITDLRARRDDITAPLKTALHAAQQQHRDAAAHADASSAAVRADTHQHLQALLAGWDGERSAAHLAALAIDRGPGRVGQRRRQVQDARQHLKAWADRWRPHHPSLPTDPDALVRYALARQSIGELDRALTPAAQHRATLQHPEHDSLLSAAQATRVELAAARAALADATRPIDRQLAQLPPVSDSHQRLADLEHALHDARSVLDAARHRIEMLQRDPALLTHPDQLETARTRWHLEHERQRTLSRAVGAATNRPLQRQHEPLLRPDDGPSISL